LLNVNLKDSDKKKIKELVNKSKEDKSMSEFVRKIISEKVKINDIINKLPKDVPITIPDYIPKNKYVAFVKGAVVGDDPSDVAAGNIIINK